MRSLIDQVDEYRKELDKGKSVAARDRGAESLDLFRQYLSSGPPIGFEPDLLRDFLGRWYIETRPSHPGQSPSDTVRALKAFAKWLEQCVPDYVNVSDCKAVLEELEQTLPRALEIADMLSREIAKRGGAFTFPEFLTTFEEGGQSNYDLEADDEGPESSGIEGYFRVVRVEGTLLELEETLSEERFWPVVLPAQVAALLGPDWLLNLEIVSSGKGWQVAGCGFAYPPGVDLDF